MKVMEVYTAFRALYSRDEGARIMLRAWHHARKKGETLSLLHVIHVAEGLGWIDREMDIVGIGGGDSDTPISPHHLDDPEDLGKPLETGQTCAELIEEAAKGMPAMMWILGREYGVRMKFEKKPDGNIDSIIYPQADGSTITCPYDMAKIVFEFADKQGTDNE